MTTLDSSSTAESSMDDDTGSNSHNHLQTPTKPSSLNTAAATTTNAARSRPCGGELEDNDIDRDNFAEDGGGGEVWGAFTENFREVQSVLDRNRVLIQQVNENHRSKNHSNLVKNVALIQEINGNISKVVSLYSDLSSNFSSVFHSRDGGPQT